MVEIRSGSLLARDWIRATPQVIASMAAVTEPHDLYGLPLEDFVPGRAGLTKALRKEGRREQAAEVSSLRKPSVAAWAVNQLVRTRAREIAALFAAGDALDHAQSELLAGRGDARALRDAVERERDAVSELVEVAQGLLSAQGHQLTPATLERVSESLHAAAFDKDARAQVKDGCLARELRYVGLGQSSSLSQSAPAASSAAKTRAQPKAPKRAETKRTERARAERLKAARAAEADARRAAERAERQLRTAQGRRDDAADVLLETEDALAAAREQAERATLEHDRADRALKQL
jgi:hypothetical protein